MTTQNYTTNDVAFFAHTILVMVNCIRNIATLSTNIGGLGDDKNFYNTPPRPISDASQISSLGTYAEWFIICFDSLRYQFREKYRREISFEDIDEMLGVLVGIKRIPELSEDFKTYYTKTLLLYRLEQARRSNH